MNNKEQKTGLQSPTGSGFKPNSAPKPNNLGKQLNPYGAWPTTTKKNPVPYKK